jgi:predicted Rdx family selenoprotein
MKPALNIEYCCHRCNWLLRTTSVTKVYLPGVKKELQSVMLVTNFVNGL